MRRSSHVGSSIPGASDPPPTPHLWFFVSHEATTGLAWSRRARVVVCNQAMEGRLLNICVSQHNPPSIQGSSPPPHQQDVLWRRGSAEGRPPVSPGLLRGRGTTVLCSCQVGTWVVSGTASLQATKTSLRMKQSKCWFLPSGVPCWNQPRHGHSTTKIVIIFRISLNLPVPSASL